MQLRAFLLLNDYWELIVTKFSPMKKLLVLLVLLPLLGSAQDTIPKHNRTPGDELRIASKRGGLGVVMVFGGSAVIALSQSSKDIPRTFAVLGGAVGILGFVFMINGWSHLNKAGILMNERKLGLTFNEGVGIRYRI